MTSTASCAKAPDSRNSVMDEYATSQAMIDINASHLDGLRTQCELTAALTQGEIRAIETKLVKLFGRQLLARQKALKDADSKNKNKPIQTKLWLKIVGIPDQKAQLLINEVEDNFEKLIFMEPPALQSMMKKLGLEEELQRRILDSTRNLNTYIECLQVDARTANELDLHWDSWDQDLDKLMDRHSSASMGMPSYPRAVELSNFRSCPTSPPIFISGIEMNNSSWASSVNSNISNNFLPNSSRSGSPLLGSRKEHEIRPRFVTPTALNAKKPPIAAINAIDANKSLIKSKSHEEKLTNRVDPETLNAENRRRLATEPGIGRGSPVMFSPIRSPPVNSELGSDGCFDESPSQRNHNNNNHSHTNNSNQSSHATYQNPNVYNLPPPRSPRAHGVMMHTIHHRFVGSMKVSSMGCELCKKPMIFGFKCKECKYRCHRECIPKVPPSCGLPAELVTLFRETLNARKAADQPMISNSIPHRLSPVPFNKEPHSLNIQPEPQHTPHMLRKARLNREPGKQLAANGINNESNVNNIASNTSSGNSSNASSPTVKNNQCSPQPAANLPPQGTFTFPNSTQSMQNNTNDETIMFRAADLLASTGSNYDLEGSGQSGDISEKVWPRQNSLSLREWDIPIDEVKIEKQIGRGRFGTVYKANWHGLVVLKLFSVSNFSDAESAIAAFKIEVATLRKTRHDNLVLFMGACMKPPQLGIVTSFCKGDTLHFHIHLRKERFPLSSLVNIAQQIAQGMGYLHARGILHKDLKTSNIFYDPNNSRVTITDFGLFSLTKLCIVDKNNYQLQIPKGWLAYLSPELIRMLRPDSDYENDNLPFSIYTDVYSFGTVWHELLSGAIPYKGEHPEVVIWQVGKGMKQPLRNLQASKEIKDILMVCWAYRPQERPDFYKLSEIFKNLPKRRLQRSPSHPTHLLRSLESIF